MWLYPILVLWISEVGINVVNGCWVGAGFIVRWEVDKGFQLVGIKIGQTMDCWFVKG